MTDFLPTNYEIPVSQGNYMKLVDGENNFRILSSAIVGYEYWTSENKPCRLKEAPDVTPDDIQVKDGVATKIKPFWAFAVWNYDAKQLQVLEITQKSIMLAIKALVDNKKWGDPKKYDITVTRTGQKLDTEYSTMPNPHAPIEQNILDICKSKKINLNALYENGDPFSNANDGTTSDGTKVPDFSEVNEAADIPFN